MPLDRQNYSFLERQRDFVAEIEAKLAKGEPAYGGFAEEFYADRQTRMDETAKSTLALLWCTHRPSHIQTPKQVEEANQILHQLAGESWQIALALEQTRIGYDCRAMQGKRAQEKEIADAKAVNNVD